MPDSADMPRVLLGLARDDEPDAQALLTVTGVTDAILGFHAQQAVEKSLKAVLAFRAIEFPYTHDLDGLLELCKQNGLDVPEALSDVDRLSPYGVQLRYGSTSSGENSTGRKRCVGRLLPSSGQGRSSSRSITEGGGSQSSLDANYVDACRAGLPAGHRLGERLACRRGSEQTRRPLALRGTPSRIPESARSTNFPAGLTCATRPNPRLGVSSDTGRASTRIVRASGIALRTGHGVPRLVPASPM